ncbi:hypothetical protein X801_04022 [Opisthorchis viverrini]|uniref:Uncharacterized protein n=1 Tax=Opisthorchis viverrini TaxID=6198 RepID=A0A1S8X0R9_OPIVI|nr:hypothetical protein X801_04022 [Opisthorchis viverrini]
MNPELSCAAKVCGKSLNLKGTTRSTDGENPVTYLEYEAYNSMALTVMKTIAKECRIQWPKLEYVAIIHRLGPSPNMILTGDG